MCLLAAFVAFLLTSPQSRAHSPTKLNCFVHLDLHVDSRAYNAEVCRQSQAVTCAVETNRLNLGLAFSRLSGGWQMLFHSNIFITLLPTFTGVYNNNNVVQIENLPEIFYCPSDKFSDRIQITQFRFCVGLNWIEEKKKKKKRNCK